MSSYNRRTLLVGVILALLIGGGVSYFASSAPDGLEKTQEDLGAAEPVHDGVKAAPVLFEDYNLKWLGEGFWANAAAGVFGTLLVLGLLLGLGRLLRRRTLPAR
jgi:cobalt/nickel transport protein